MTPPQGHSCCAIFSNQGVQQTGKSQCDNRWITLIGSSKWNDLRLALKSFSTRSKAFIQNLLTLQIRVSVESMKNKSRNTWDQMNRFVIHAFSLIIRQFKIMNGMLHPFTLLQTLMSANRIKWLMNDQVTNNLTKGSMGWSSSIITEN